jgi:hypothetical protein
MAKLRRILLKSIDSDEKLSLGDIGGRGDGGKGIGGRSRSSRCV